MPFDVSPPRRNWRWSSRGAPSAHAPSATRPAGPGCQTNGWCFRPRASTAAGCPLRPGVRLRGRHRAGSRAAGGAAGRAGRRTGRHAGPAHLSARARLPARDAADGRPRLPVPAARPRAHRHRGASSSGHCTRGPARDLGAHRERGATPSRHRLRRRHRGTSGRSAGVALAQHVSVPAPHTGHLRRGPRRPGHRAPGRRRGGNGRTAARHDHWDLPSGLGRQYGAPPATATRSICTRSPRGCSASRVPSRTACGPSPAAWRGRAPPRAVNSSPPRGVHGSGAAASTVAYTGTSRRQRKAATAPVRGTGSKCAAARDGAAAPHRGGAQREPVIICCRPVQQKFMRVAAVSFGDGAATVRALAHAASDSAAPTIACASADASRSTSVSSQPASRAAAGQQPRHELRHLRAHLGDLTGERFTLGIGPVQHGPAVRPRRSVREERAQAVPQLLLGTGAGHLGLPGAAPHSLDEGRPLRSYARREQVLFGVQVLVDQRFGDARRLGDVVHRRRLVTVPCESRSRGVEHLPLAHRPRHPLAPPVGSLRRLHVLAPPRLLSDDRRPPGYARRAAGPADSSGPRPCVVTSPGRGRSGRAATAEERDAWATRRPSQAPHSLHPAGAHAAAAGHLRTRGTHGAGERAPVWRLRAWGARRTSVPSLPTPDSLVQRARGRGGSTTA